MFRVQGLGSGCPRLALADRSASGFYLTDDFHEIVLQKAIPAQIRHLILYFSNDEGFVDGFVRGSTFAKRLYEHFLLDRIDGPASGQVDVERKVKHHFGVGDFECKENRYDESFAGSSHTHCFESRFAEVNSPTNPSCHPLLFLI